MSKISLGDEWIEAATIIQKQVRETVKQEAAGIGVRMATLTCPCGRRLCLLHMYQCLYCNVWYCNSCAEQHFGQTVAEYKATKSGSDHVEIQIFEKRR